MITYDKKAFTLAEVMICLAVLSILATLLIPAIVRARPDKNKVLFRKAYFMTERVVSELINDEDLYPTEEDLSGFSNTNEVMKNGETYSGNTKFCGLFSDKINTVGNSINCAASSKTFTSSDGIDWYLPISIFPADAADDEKIIVDVNGDLRPNCHYNSTTCTEPDKFEIYVRSDGKMYVIGTKEAEYLKSNTTLKKD